MKIFRYNDLKCDAHNQIRIWSMFRSRSLIFRYRDSYRLEYCSRLARKANHY